MNYTTLYSLADIEVAVNKLALQIQKDYQYKKITIICVLKGAIVFCSDLIRSLSDSDIELDFIQCQSYEGTESNNNPMINIKPCIPLKGKHVLIVEDIVDTGQSLSLIQEYIAKQKPKTLKAVVLINKPHRRQIGVTINYTGFTAPDKFVVGYGMDWNEKFRNLKRISIFNQ